MKIIELFKFKQIEYLGQFVFSPYPDKKQNNYFGASFLMKTVEIIYARSIQCINKKLNKI